MAKERLEQIQTQSWCMVPVELITSTLSAHAILCFAVMGSFGPESRASVASIRDRMRLKGSSGLKVVRKAQQELIAGGWIHLAMEATQHRTRRWTLWPKEPEGSEKSLPGLSGGLIQTGPETTPETDKNKQRKKTISPDHQTAETLELTYKTAWEGRYTRSQYYPASTDKKQFLAWAKAGITTATLKAKVETLLASEAPFYLQSRHSVWLLEREWNKLEAVEVAAPREACKHPLDKLKDTKDYGPQIYGTCSVCGWKGYVMKGGA